MMAKDEVHLVAAANQAYCIPLCVMLTSAVIHFDPERDLIIHVLSNDIGEADQESVRQSLDQNRLGSRKVDLRWHPVDLGAFESVPVHQLSSDAFSRLLAADTLPEECERAIYLDCDTVVLSDLGLLHDAAACRQTILHAVHDIAHPSVSAPLAVFNYEELGIRPDAHYFNSGVLVINLKLWRERMTTKRVVDYLIAHGHLVVFLDQGTLNAVLHDDWTPLPQTWNVCFSVLFPSLWDAAGYSRGEWSEALTHPKIVHYAGQRKPWNDGSHSPRWSYFFTYLERTVYRGRIKRKARVESLIGIRSYYYLWKASRLLSGRTC